MNRALQACVCGIADMNTHEHSLAGFFSASTVETIVCLFLLCQPVYIQHSMNFKLIMRIGKNLNFQKMRFQFRI